MTKVVKLLPCEQNVLDALLILNGEPACKRLVQSKMKPFASGYDSISKRIGDMLKKRPDLRVDRGHCERLDHFHGKRTFTTYWLVYEPTQLNLLEAV